MDLILNPNQFIDLGNAVKITSKSDNTVEFEPLYDDDSKIKMIMLNHQTAALIKVRLDGVAYLDSMLEVLPPAALNHKVFNSLLEWDKRDPREMRLYYKSFEGPRSYNGSILTVFYASVRPGVFEERVRWHKAAKARAD